uniref:Uncharacterized protein n=1 Tax=Romanomermis culicivorax TaxID=13658 RepID=A0A915KBS4_ROMCU
MLVRSLQLRMYSEDSNEICGLISRSLDFGVKELMVTLKISILTVCIDTSTGHSALVAPQTIPCLNLEIDNVEPNFATYDLWSVCELMCYEKYLIWLITSQLTKERFPGRNSNMGQVTVHSKARGQMIHVTPIVPPKSYTCSRIIKGQLEDHSAAIVHHNAQSYPKNIIG